MSQDANKLPVLIQGGMGVGVSGWRLARRVSELGHLGVVSGTGIDSLLIRRIEQGQDLEHLMQAIEAFPLQEVSALFKKKYGPKTHEKAPRYSLLPMLRPKLPLWRQRLLMLSSFVEVHLAKESQPGLVGINFLEKIQIPSLSSIYGAILAGVDYILMGAGIPTEIPGAIDQLLRYEEASLSLAVVGNSGEREFRTRFDPKDHFGSHPPQGLRRPHFLPIVSSASLARALLKRSSGKIDGFVVEHHSAGGHNAPPRGMKAMPEKQSPCYSERDEIEFEKFRELEVPFWLAGSYGQRRKLQFAQSVGAQGVQVGTAFALCRESGLAKQYKHEFLQKLCAGEAAVETDFRASPTGFPFKVAEIEGSLSSDLIYEERSRKCDLGYLRQPYQKPDGGLGFRCPAEPQEHFLEKGGIIEETEGRKCLCNALFANIGLGQYQGGAYLEPALVTLGDDYLSLKNHVESHGFDYDAESVVNEIVC